MSFWYRNGGCSNNGYSYKRPKKWGLRFYAGTLTALCAAVVTAYAQEGVPAGLVARLDVTQRFEYSDNPDFRTNGSSEFFGRTVLGFSLQSETRAQRFSLNLGTEIEEGRDNQSNLEVDNTDLSLNYERYTGNARFGTNFSYRESDHRASLNDVDFDQNGNIINQNSGTRESLGYGLEFAVGQQAPVGAEFRWRYRELRFSGTNDPNLTGSSTNDFSGQIDFKIDPRITASLTVNTSNSTPPGMA